MGKRYALRDDQWERIKGLLPGREDTVGVTAKDNRLFVEAVLYRYRAGIPWRDLPERFGNWSVVHTRFSRWAVSGVWINVFEHLATVPSCGRINTVQVLKKSMSPRRRGTRRPGHRAQRRRIKHKNSCDDRCAGQSHQLHADARTSLRFGRLGCSFARA